MDFITMGEAIKRLGIKGAHYQLFKTSIGKHVEVIPVGGSFLIYRGDFDAKLSVIIDDAKKEIQKLNDNKIDKRLIGNRAIIPDEIKLLAKKKKLLSDILKIEKQLKEMA